MNGIAFKAGDGTPGRELKVLGGFAAVFAVGCRDNGTRG